MMTGVLYHERAWGCGWFAGSLFQNLLTQVQTVVSLAMSCPNKVHELMASTLATARE